MTISRWKIMAGVLGVSLGGLAAFAGPCKPAEHKTARADEPKADAPPAGPRGGVDPLKLPEVPPPAANDPFKAGPVVPPIGGTELKAPAVTPVVPIAGVTPAVPTPPAAGTPAAPVTALPAAGTPTAPTAGPPTPPVAGSPMVPPATVNLPADPAPLVQPVTTTPTVAPTTPAVAPPAFSQQPAPPPVVSGPEQGPPPAVQRPTVPVTTPAPPASVPQATQQTATKFRIILRVGEGEPTFEVRSGDDLVMKVVCEKVDIKSPERGQALSAVTASGRVRFVGFGSEGSCDSLSFLAGTGEVSMSGNVKIQVKDKLGRVESELTTETIKYRIDTSALPGSLRP